MRSAPTDTGVLAGVLLDACPHCGEGQHFEALEGVAVQIDEFGEEGELSCITCLSCGASGPLRDGGLVGAVTGWNERRVRSASGSGRH